MKFEYILCISIVILLSIGLGSCKKDAKKLAAEKIVAEWTGKEIIFPDGMQCTFLGRDTFCIEEVTPYKILVYTDSTDCTDCKFQFSKWNNLIEESNTIIPGKISFYFFFLPKDESQLKIQFDRYDFRQIVYIDRESKFYSANKFPSNMSYQCFLLDKDNKVVLIGNPILNPKIWDLYLQIVTGKENIEHEHTDECTNECAHKTVISTTVEIEQSEIELEDTKIFETSIATFIIKNTGEVPLIIKDISVSCGCTVPEWDKKPIKPGEKTKIIIKVTPDDKGFFRKTVSVFCNTNDGAFQLSIKSTVKG